VRELLDRSGAQHHEKVRTERIPVHESRVREPRRQTLAADGIGHLVTELEPNLRAKIFGKRQLRRLGAAAPPLAGDHFVRGG
jgi:hypothetical protein